LRGSGIRGVISGRKEGRVKLKVYVIDLEVPPRVKKWVLRIGVAALLLGAATVAIAAAPLHMWATGDVLEATDLNGNFSNLQAQISAAWVPQGDDLHNANASGRVGIGTPTPSAALDVNGAFIRKIARSHGNGPNDQTTGGAIASRLLQYTKTQDATGTRITWQDNLRCYGAAVSCEWEIKVDGASCAKPGPLVYDMYNDSAGTAQTINIHRPQEVVGTCFGITAGPHTIQVYVKAPASNPADGGAGATNPGIPWTGWNASYWSLEVEEVY
jgi:hypothetical protein